MTAILMKQLHIPVMVKSMIAVLMKQFCLFKRVQNLRPVIHASSVLVEPSVFLCVSFPIQTAVLNIKRNHNLTWRMVSLKLVQSMDPQMLQIVMLILEE